MYLNTSLLSSAYNDDALKQMVKEEFPYPTFQEGQDRAIFEAVKALAISGKKHVVIDAPTGVGKTAIAYTIHRILERMVRETNSSPNPTFNWRTTISTTTKGLQDQYTGDFPDIVDLRGKTNYPCPIGAVSYNSLSCKMKLRDKECNGRSCPYVMARREWCNAAECRVTNSAMIIEMCPLICMMEDNWAPLLIIDECHKLPNSILDHTIMEFSYQELERYAKNKLPGAEDILGVVERILEHTDRWKVGEIVRPEAEFTQACDQLHDLTELTLKVLEQLIKDDSLGFLQIERINDCIIFLQRLSDFSEICSATNAKDFVVHERQTRQFNAKRETEYFIRLKPILAKDVSEFAVFRKNDYFVHMSATVCGAEAYLDDLGIPRNQAHVITLDNPIPKENRVIKYIPVGSMSASYQMQTMPDMVEAIAHIVDTEHDGQCGLVHVSSYKLAEDLISRMPQSLKSKVMIGRKREETLKELYSAVKNNRQLVVFSPSMKEGYDLKGDLCRFQIIAKVPFGNLGDQLVKYVANKNRGAYIRETVLDVVQSCGRGVRGVNDEAVTYILDSAFDNVMKNGWDYLPQWWKDTLTQF